MESKTIKRNRILNRIICCQLIIIGVYISSLLSLLVELPNWQRVVVRFFMGTNAVYELTYDECVQYFGEPLTMSDNGTATFWGGKAYRAGLACEYYEYILIIRFDEETERIDQVRLERIMERIIW